MNKLLYRDHQFLYVENRFKDYGKPYMYLPLPIDIPSNKKIFEDYIKDYAVEDKIKEQIKANPEPYIIKRGSITTISIPHQRSDRESLTTDEDMDIDYYSGSSESADL